MTEDRGLGHLPESILDEEIAEAEKMIEDGTAGPFAPSVVNVYKAEKESRKKS
jgi:hypothetical protein